MPLYLCDAVFHGFVDEQVAGLQLAEQVTDFAAVLFAVQRNGQVLPPSEQMGIETIGPAAHLTHA
jgi:hypothetical protein